MTLRKAGLRDIPAMQALIGGYAAQGIMLPRTELELAEHIRDFMLVHGDDGALLGCGALHIYTPRSGEVRSLAVAPEAKGRGAGKQLVEALVREAAEFGLRFVFAFTYVPQFFEKVQFYEVDRSKLPLKAWKDCLRCPKFQACDEIAVLRMLGDAAELPPDAGIEIPPSSEGLIQLPKLPQAH